MFLCMSPVILIRFCRNGMLWRLYLFCTNTVDCARPRNKHNSDSSSYCVLYLVSSENPSMDNLSQSVQLRRRTMVCVCLCVCVCVCVCVCRVFSFVKNSYHVYHNAFLIWNSPPEWNSVNRLFSFTLVLCIQSQCYLIKYISTYPKAANWRRRPLTELFCLHCLLTASAIPVVTDRLAYNLKINFPVRTYTSVLKNFNAI
jgi:hypothetical protein